MKMLRAQSHRRMPWRNGGGSTREIVAWPQPNDWDFRLSIADVEHSGPFSVIADVNRTIALLDGNGFVLRVGDALAETVIDHHRPFNFDGELDTICTLIDGPVRDLNLMVRRSASPRQLNFVHVVDAVSIGDVELLLVVEGAVHLNEEELWRFDATHLTVPTPITISSTSEHPAVVAVVSPIT
jgi:uncharacterized protein